MAAKAEHAALAILCDVPCIILKALRSCCDLAASLLAAYCQSQHTVSRFLQCVCATSSRGSIHCCIPMPSSLIIFKTAAYSLRVRQKVRDSQEQGLLRLPESLRIFRRSTSCSILLVVGSEEQRFVQICMHQSNIDW